MVCDYNCMLVSNTCADALLLLLLLCCVLHELLHGFCGGGQGRRNLLVPADVFERELQLRWRVMGALPLLELQRF